MTTSMRAAKIALLHIPKTGGRALGSVILEQTQSDPTYFFNFSGQDSSRGANRIVVEQLRKGERDHQVLLQNRHFLESRVIMGHFSYDLRNILDGFSLEFAAVLREPIGRCISNIYQYATDMPTRRRLGSLEVPSKTQDPAGFWREVRSILEKFMGQAIPGQLPHESMMLQNGMCHVIGGTPLHTYTPKADVDRAMNNLSVFKLALFERFNETCGPMIRSLGLPVVVDDRTNRNGAGFPPSHHNHAVNFGAPDNVIELVRAMNQDDIQLYREASARFASPGASQ